MRMWKVSPNLMCRKHLMGEHLEMHQFAGSIKKGKSLDGYINGKMLEVGNIKNRHDELVKEMSLRGYIHKSPLEEPAAGTYKFVVIDAEENAKLLRSRCEECSKRIEGKL